MKYVLICFALLFSLYSNAQTVTIPDSAFKQFLIDVGVDLNGDEEIQVSEAEVVESLSIGGNVEIYSIEGIKSFVNLQTLEIEYIDITTVDISGMENISMLDISTVGLQTIDATNCINLDFFNLFDTDFVDLVDLSGCTSLVNLGGSICADVIKLNNCTSLENLRFFGCNFSSLELEGCISLNYFEASDINDDFTFDFSQVPALEQFWVYGGNMLGDFEVANAPNLRSLEIEQAASITVRSCPELKTFQFWIAGNVDVFDLPKLINLSLAGPIASNIRIENCPSYNLFDINGDIGELVIVACSSIQAMQISGGISRLAINNCHSLQSIDFTSGTDSEIWDFSDSPALISIIGEDGPRELVLDGCYNLETFNIGGTFGNLYDFSPCINLQNIEIGISHLESLIIQNGSMETLTIESAFLLKNICIDPDDFAQVTALISSLGLDNINITTSCDFADGGKPFAITGTFFHDENNDSCQTSEKTVPFSKFKVPTDTGSEGLFYSDEEGNFDVKLSEGQYTVEYDSPFGDYIFMSSPENWSVSFPDDGTTANQDFCLTASPEVVDIIEVNLIPLEIARPGFDAKYLVTYTNTGNVTRGGEIKLTFQDEFMDIISSEPMVDEQEEGFLSWSFEDLAPFDSRSIEFVMNLNSPMEDPALNNGDILNFRAEVGPFGNQTLTVYWSHLNQEVVNSFDPNDKICLDGNAFAQNLVGDYLKYMIRFENTGTAEAVNIVVSDTLDETKFDVRSLQVIGSSHEVETELEGNVVKFFFRDIYLPIEDETNDGYVTFKIKTLPTLELGDDIQNKAEIFFDFNFPIVTNTTSTTISDFTSVIDVDKVSFDFNISPNPATESIFITSEVPIDAIEIWETSGRLIEKTNLSSSKKQHHLSIDHLVSGVYIIKAISNDDFSVAKIVIE